MATFYKGYRIDLLSYKRKSRSWSPWATIALDTGDRITFSQIQSSKITGCKTEREANAQALAVAKAWIDRWTL